jgi:hypothetical protein
MQNNIKLHPIKEKLNGELAETIYYNCCFCQKTVGLYPDQRKICEKLSGTRFYCQQCLQKRFDTKNNQHVLMLSFRGIIGFYYYNLHLSQKKLYHSQIEDFIESHEQTGLQNPLFQYDPDTFVWFIDFSRVGRGKKKIAINEVLKTTINILSCFNLTQNIDNIKVSKMFFKYEEAILKFHQSRYRPANKKILVPTLINCGGMCDHQNVDHDMFKNFTKDNFLMKGY